MHPRCIRSSLRSSNRTDSDCSVRRATRKFAPYGSQRPRPFASRARFGLYRSMAVIHTASTTVTVSSCRWNLPYMPWCGFLSWITSQVQVQAIMTMNYKGLYAFRVKLCCGWKKCERIATFSSVPFNPFKFNYFRVRSNGRTHETGRASFAPHLVMVPPIHPHSVKLVSVQVAVMAHEWCDDSESGERGIRDS